MSSGSANKPPTDRAALQARYQELRDRGLVATRLGRLLEAKVIFAQAAEAAQGLDDDFQDRAFCNVALIDIELGGNLEPIIPRLRDILIRSSDAESCRLAAYHLARIYDLRDEYKKALFYARVARERSERTGRDQWIASSHNQMGSLLMAESRFEEAVEELEKALELMPEDSDDLVARAMIQANLGYCLLIQKEPAGGFRLLFDSLRSLRRLGARGREAILHESLCFGYLDLGRMRPALRHGLRALQLAEEHGDSHGVKNALFLLGEAANQAGHTDEARAYFTRLQKQHFPEHEFLTDFLLAVDVRGLVNLRA